MNIANESTVVELNRARALWAACCLSPVVYLGLAMAVEWWWLAPSGRTGFWSLDDSALTVVRFWCVAVVLLLVTVVITLRLVMLSRPLAAGSIRRLTVWLVGLAECCLWPGVVMFAVGGGLRPLFASGAAAFVCYALAFPFVPAPAGSKDDDEELTG